MGLYTQTIIQTLLTCVIGQYTGRFDEAKVSGLEKARGDGKNGKGKKNGGLRI